MEPSTTWLWWFTAGKRLDLDCMTLPIAPRWTHLITCWVTDCGQRELYAYIDALMSACALPQLELEMATDSWLGLSYAQDMRTATAPSSHTHVTLQHCGCYTHTSHCNTAAATHTRHIATLRLQHTHVTLQHCGCYTHTSHCNTAAAPTSHTYVALQHDGSVQKLPSVILCDGRRGSRLVLHG
jgi:hypothetical protein